MPLVSGGAESNGLRFVKDQWLLGNWRALAGIELSAIDGQADRAEIALLAGSALQQLGEAGRAETFIRQAAAWGCPRRTLAQVLIAGACNTFGNIAAIRRDDEQAASYFARAVDADRPGRADATRLAERRRNGEMARIGLFADAAARLELRLAGELRSRPGTRSRDRRFDMLKSEMDQLRHELTLALDRRQIQVPRPGDRDAGAVASPGEDARTARENSMAQLGQDVWVLENTGFRRGGFFVEVGAANGVLLSNSWLLEKKFGWNGICVEPNPSFLTELRANRACIVTGDCIGPRTGDEVEFILADVYGGIAAYAGDDMHSERREAYRAAGDVARLTTLSLDDLLVRHGAPRRIDYISIDTEGSEFDILESFPFADWDVALLTVEHNFTARRKDIRNLLEGHGYDCIEREWDDWFFRRSPAYPPVSGSGPKGA